MTVIDRFASFYQTLAVADIAQLTKIYADDITLIDPVGTHHGLGQLTAYFKNLLVNAKHCEFAIHHIAAHELQPLLQHQSYTVTWTMSFTTPRLNGGETIHVDGITLLKVRDDAIFFHQDYYDLGQMVYEQVPILKFIINKIKTGMRA